MAEYGGCYTVGHSTHSIEDFVALLQRYGIDAVVDVRSSPYSRMAPQFNRESLMHQLKREECRYIYLGNMLGARYDDEKLLFSDGLVDFEAVRRTERFQEGVVRVRNGLAKGYTIALMCSEKEPFDCHRFVLVARELSLQGVEVTHILPEITLSQKELEERLFSKYKRSRYNLLTSEDEALAEVYRLRNRDIAYNAFTKEGDEL